MNPDRSRRAALVAVLTIALLVGAWFAPWFIYDFNSGRQTPPGGPQPADETGEVTHHLRMGTTGWEGDIEPSDSELARAGVLAINALLGVAAFALLLVAAGELPGVHRIFGRRASLTFIGIAMTSTMALVFVAALLLPASMEGHGIEGVYTARLDEPDGYTRGYMHTAWYLVMLSVASSFTAGLFKFQAGASPGTVLRERIRARTTQD